MMRLDTLLNLKLNPDSTQHCKTLHFSVNRLHFKTALPWMLSFFLALLLSTSALAQSKLFLGEGACLVPTQKTRISMLEQHVTIQALTREGPWHIDASYIFSNPKRRSVSVTMALPERHCGTDENCDPSHPGKFIDLKTTARGEAIAAREATPGELTNPRKGKPQWVPTFGRVWLYNITFKPKESIKIVQRYTLDATSDNQGLMLRYITRTARLWRGSVGKTTLIVRLPARPFSMRWPITYKWSRDNEDRNDKGKLVTEYVFKARNWKPLQNLIIHFGGELYDPLNGRCPDFEATIDAAKAEKDKPGYLQRVLTMRTDDDLRLCGNLARARHGYPFASKVMRELFYNNEKLMERIKTEVGFNKRKHRFCGMTPNKTWSEALLSPQDKLYMSAITQELTRREADGK